jgi:hypothetical protein
MTRQERRREQWTRAWDSVRNRFRNHRNAWCWAGELNRKGARKIARRLAKHGGAA